MGPGVFVPRPETELLVDAVLPVLRASPHPIAVDLCAGSGALALAVADEVPSATVYAVERSPSALHWLRRNCAGSKVQVVSADVGDRELAARADRTGSTRCWPIRLTWGPARTSIRRCATTRPTPSSRARTDSPCCPPWSARRDGCSAPGACLAVEHGDQQGTAITALLSGDDGWRQVVDHRDLAGRPRYLTAERTSFADDYSG